MVTRYSKNGKGFKWTIKELKNIPEEYEGDYVNDGNGLFGKICLLKDRTVSIHFVYKFKWGKKGCEINCGSFPKNDINHIRLQRDLARKHLNEGFDPRLKRKTDKLQAQKEQIQILESAQEEANNNKTFGELYEQWISVLNRKNDSIELKRMFEKDVLPILQNIPLKNIQEQHIRTIFQIIKNRSTSYHPNYSIIKKLSIALKQLFKWAEIREPWRKLLDQGNPVILVDMKTYIPTEYDETRDRILSDYEIKKLFHIIYNSDLSIENTTKYAIGICFSTMCRIGELLQSKWEHINFKNKTWFIPKENIKKTSGKRSDFIIFLSDFSLSFFEKLYYETGNSTWCFPSKRNNSKHMGLTSISGIVGNKQVVFHNRKLPLTSKNYNNDFVLGSTKWTLHDLRRTGATIMQRLNITLDVIDKCQNHQLAGSRIRRHYLHHDYAEEKKEAWEKLGNKLKELFSSNE